MMISENTFDKPQPRANIDYPGKNDYEWNITREIFDGLLLLLDPDRERAGLIYESIRRKLILYFERHRITIAEECVDMVIDRVARKTAEGTVIYEVNGYFFGVARRVLLQIQREQRQQCLALQCLTQTLKAVRPADSQETYFAKLDRALQILSTEEQELILIYYQDSGRTRIERRRQLADDLGIDLNALRIRAHRIRSRIAEYLDICLEEPLLSQQAEPFWVANVKSEITHCSVF